MKAPPWTAPLALSLALRLPGLGAVPNPAGDEGNWAMLALRLERDLPAALPPDAAFVTTLFARLAAFAFHLFGPSFAAARSVLVAAIALAIIASARLSERPREGAAVGLVLALHPWSVLWSRTASVPYALALSLGVAGPLAWLDALRTRRWYAVLLASHLVCAAMHFSPLALVPIAACSLWALYERLPLKLAPVALSGLVHAIPFVTSALAAMRVGSQTVPPLREPFFERLATMCAMLLGDLAGTSSAAHFAGCPRWELRAGVALAFAFAVGVFAHARGGGERARFAALHLALAFVVTPLLLVPARAWSMPVIDADRYGFALVAPAAIAVGAMASSSRSWRLAALAFVVWIAGVTAGVAHHFARGTPEGDLGLFVARDGGRYRGWQVAREGAPLVDLIRDAALRDAHGEPATIVTNDYALHPLRFSLALRGDDVGLTHSHGATPLRRGDRVYLVAWSDGAFASEYRPRAAPAEAARFRARIVTGYDQARRVRTFVTSGGAPICELWSARVR